MGSADLHIHSNRSDGTATISAILHHSSAHTDLDVIAITDHNTLDGSIEARELASDFRVDVITGMEIATREGHLLALFMESPVSPGLSFVETAQTVRLFGGLPYVAHPTSSFGRSLPVWRLREIVQRYPGLLAGIEAENGSILNLNDNEAAQALRWELGLPGIGNSDAHILDEIGSARTLFPGTTVADLRVALEAGTVIPLPAKRRKRFFRHHAARLALRYGLGIVETVKIDAKGSRLQTWVRNK
jgi:predicted metal-dependent phosphoesterase TrpH